MGVIPGNSHPSAESSLSVAQINGLSGVTEESALQQANNKLLPSWMRAKDNLFANILGDIAGGILGVIGGVAGAVLPSWLPKPIQDAAIEVRDGQIGLKNETELLKGVRGFCAAYQTKNVNIEWDFSGNKTRELPFNGKVLDNPKGAHIEGNGIVFDEVGLWVIYCVARARNTGYTGGNGVSLFVDVNNPDGSLYSNMIFDGSPGTSFATVGGSIPVLISQPGQRIRVTAWSDRWRWWDGGMRYARLAVVKIDSSDNTKPPNEVPDESQPQGTEATSTSARTVNTNGVTTYSADYTPEDREEEDDK